MRENNYKKKLKEQWNKNSNPILKSLLILSQEIEKTLKSSKEFTKTDSMFKYLISCSNHVKDNIIYAYFLNEKDIVEIYEKLLMRLEFSKKASIISILKDKIKYLTPPILEELHLKNYIKEDGEIFNKKKLSAEFIGKKYRQAKQILGMPPSMGKFIINEDYKKESAKIVQSISNKYSLASNIISRYIAKLHSQAIRNKTGIDNTIIKFMLEIISVKSRHLDRSGMYPIIGIGCLKTIFRKKITIGFLLDRGINEWFNFFSNLKHFDLPFRLKEGPTNTNDLVPKQSLVILNSFKREEHKKRYVKVDPETGLLMKFNNDVWFKRDESLTKKERTEKRKEKNPLILNAWKYLTTKRVFRLFKQEGYKYIAYRLNGYVYENWGNLESKMDPNVWNSIYKSFTYIYTDFDGEKCSVSNFDWRDFLDPSKISESAYEKRELMISKLLLMSSYDSYNHIAADWYRRYYERYKPAEPQTGHWKYAPSFFSQSTKLFYTLTKEVGMPFDYDRNSGLHHGAYFYFTSLETAFMDLKLDLDSLLMGKNRELGRLAIEEITNWTLEHIEKDDFADFSKKIWKKADGKRGYALNVPNSTNTLLCFDISWIRNIRKMEKIPHLFSNGLEKYGTFVEYKKCIIVGEAGSIISEIDIPDPSRSEVSQWERNFFISQMNEFGLFIKLKHSKNIDEKSEDYSEESQIIKYQIREKYGYLIDKLICGRTLYEKILQANEEHRPEFLRLHNSSSGIFSQLSKREQRVFERYAQDLYLRNKQINRERRVFELQKIATKYFKGIIRSKTNFEASSPIKAIMDDMFAYYKWPLDKYQNVSFQPGKLSLAEISGLNLIPINRGDDIKHDIYFLGFYLELSLYRHINRNYGDLIQGLNYINDKIYSSLFAALNGRSLMFIAPKNFIRTYYFKHINKYGAQVFAITEKEALMLTRILKTLTDLLEEAGIHLVHLKQIMRNIDILDVIRNEEWLNKSITRAQLEDEIPDYMKKKLECFNLEKILDIMNCRGKMIITKQKFIKNVVGQMRPRINSNLYRKDCVFRYKLAQCRDKREFEDIFNDMEFLDILRQNPLIPSRDSEKRKEYKLLFPVPDSGGKYLAIYTGDESQFYGQLARFDKDGTLNMLRGKYYKAVHPSEDFFQHQYHYYNSISKFKDLKQRNWAFKTASQLRKLK